MRSLFSIFLFILFLNTSTFACLITSSNLVLQSDNGTTGTYTITLLYNSNGNQDSNGGTLTISSPTPSVNITAGSGPFACACNGFSYNITFTAPLGTDVDFIAFYDQPGGGTSNNCTTPAISVPLPVEYLFIKGVNYNNYNQLSWTTAQEINNEGFYVQKSIDGYYYEEMEFIKGAGNSNSEIEYKIIDYDIKGFPILYYRLNQVDFDGGNALSKVIAIESSLSRNSTDFKQIENTIYFNEHIQSVEIFDTAGNKVFSSNNIKELSTNYYTPGIYILRVNGASHKVYFN